VAAVGEKEPAISKQRPADNNQEPADGRQVPAEGERVLETLHPPKNLEGSESLEAALASESDLLGAPFSLAQPKMRRGKGLDLESWKLSHRRATTMKIQASLDGSRTIRCKP
jgi:hypothetical protein